MKNSPIPKVNKPVLENILVRDRLFHALDHARGKKVVWITGLPGSGKTTLAASYLSARKLSYAWYHMDNGDIDPSTFFYYLRHVLPDPRHRARLPLLTPEYLLHLEMFSLRYFESLFGMLHGRFVLVFDNYHEIGNDALLHVLMSSACVRLPDRGTIVLISRTEPPEAYDGLLTSEAMAIIDNEAIKFTPEETAGLIRLKTGRNPDADAMRGLHDFTDGWVAGLILLLEQQRVQLAAADRKPLQDYRTVFEYFSAEVFDRVDPETHEFLLRTSFFPSMTAGMAVRLTGNRSSERILNHLVKNHYFTIKHQNGVYQYHDLFREFLIAKARTHFDTHRLERIQMKAAALLRQNGKYEEAIGLFARSARWNESARIIKAHAQDLIAQGRNNVLEAWIKNMPGETVDRDPWLLYWLGESCALFAPVQGRTYFERAFKIFLGNGTSAAGVRKRFSDGLYLSWCGILETFFYEFGNYKHTEKWIAAMEKIVTRSHRFPSRELEARVFSLMVQVLTFQMPAHPRIEKWAQRALSLLQYIKNPDMRAYYLSYVTNYHSWTGNIVQFDRLIELMKSIGNPRTLSIKAKLLYMLFMAVHARHLSFREPCLHAVDEALAIANEHGVHFFDHLIIAQAIYLLFGLGDIKKIEEYLKIMGTSVNQSSLLEAIQYNSMLGWLDKEHGSMQSAIGKIEYSLQLSLKMGAPFPEAIHRLALAELYYLEGEYTTAAGHLRRSFFLGRKIKSHMLVYIAGILKASWMLDEKVFSDEKNGLRLLKKTMRLGRQYGIINTFMESRQIRTRMCLQALENGIEVPYVRTLIQRLEMVPDRSRINYEDWPWAFRFYALGGFKVFRDDKAVALSRKSFSKPLELLQYLIVHGNGASFEQVSTVLWPDAPGDYAHQTLDTTIHRLRRLLGSSDAVISQSGTLLLNPRTCWVDAAACEQYIDAAENIIGAGDAQKGKIERYTAAVLHLYKGRFLAGTNLPSWAMSFRDRLHDRFLHFIERLGMYYEERSDINRALRVYRKGLETDDQVELFYQRLMGIYKSLGRTSEAVAAYKRCAAVLSRDLGIGPSDATKELYYSVKA